LYTSSDSSTVNKSKAASVCNYDAYLMSGTSEISVNLTFLKSFVQTFAYSRSSGSLDGDAFLGLESLPIISNIDYNVNILIC
jgi:hypothetical protein